MLALNCVCPATSTLVTLLVHTSRGQSVTFHNLNLNLFLFLLSMIEKFRFPHMFMFADVSIASIQLAQKVRTKVLVHCGTQQEVTTAF